MYGASGHGIGTAAAIKLGPVQGATAGIAIGMSGLFTVLFYSILSVLHNSQYACKALKFRKHCAILCC